MSRPHALKPLVTAVVLVSICSAVFISTNTRARAANPKPSALSSGKISPDLQKLILSGNGDARVRVIVQTKPSSSGGGLIGGLLNLVGGLLQTVGGVLVAVLSNLNVIIADVQANSVEVLASNPDVTYISLDNRVSGAGHIVTTTGAQQVRSQKSLLGLNSTLDGAGITIAVVDSGIDSKHKSFATLGKIKFS